MDDQVVGGDGQEDAGAAASHARPPPGPRAPVARLDNAVEQADRQRQGDIAVVDPEHQKCQKADPKRLSEALFATVQSEPDGAQSHQDRAVIRQEVLGEDVKGVAACHEHGAEQAFFFVRADAPQDQINHADAERGRQGEQQRRQPEHLPRDAQQSIPVQAVIVNQAVYKAVKQGRRQLHRGDGMMVAIAQQAIGRRPRNRR